MTDRLAEIRARLDAATPGPNGARLFPPIGIPQPWGPPLMPTVDRPNADLIAHAPTDIAWLLDRLDELETERDAVLDWSHENRHRLVTCEEVDFQYGIVRFTLPDDSQVSGTCSCGAESPRMCRCRARIAGMSDA
ncbi:MAG: hypothetical protein RIS35_1471 [Pseudomonadota bacterium]